MDILDRGYGRPPQHLTGEDAPVYVARLPEPCKMAEEWEALVKARWSLPSDQASSLRPKSKGAEVPGSTPGSQRNRGRLGIHQWPSMSAPGLAPTVSSFGQD